MSEDKPGPARERAGAIRKITLGDVAAVAKVSPATVSRALSRPQLVREDVRERIANVISKLGYLPNGAARALASRRSGTLGAVVPTFRNAIFADSIEAYQQRLEQFGYVTLVATSEYDSKLEFARAKALIERGVDGLMLVGHRRPPDLLALLQDYGIPFIDTWVSRTNFKYPCVGYNGVAGGELITSYLTSLGHTDFAVITGDPNKNDRIASRLAGIRKALVKSGARLEPDRLIICDDMSISDARDAARRIMGSGVPPTAIICGNDMLAIAALAEARHHRLDVPHDISITGFGDMDIAAAVDPPLTTVRSPRGEIGHIAAEYLLARIDGREFALPKALDLHLVVRESSGPPRRGGRLGPSASPRKPDRARRALQS